MPFESVPANPGEACRCSAGHLAALGRFEGSALPCLPRQARLLKSPHVIAFVRLTVCSLGKDFLRAVQKHRPRRHCPSECQLSLESWTPWLSPT